MSTGRVEYDDFKDIALPVSSATSAHEQLGPRYLSTLDIIAKSPLTSELKAQISVSKATSSRMTADVKDWMAVKDHFETLGPGVMSVLPSKKFLVIESALAKKIGMAVKKELMVQLKPDAKQQATLQKEVVCVSFITAHLNKHSTTKKYCYVSLSGSGNAPDYKAVKDAFDTLIAQQKLKEGYELKILPPVSPRFHFLLKHVADQLGIPFDMNRLCAEIAFHPVIAKLLYFHGNDFELEGVVNIPIPVYVPADPKRIAVAAAASPLSAWDASPPWKSSPNTVTHHWECCDYCKNNKPLYLLLWASMQQLGIQKKSKKSPPNKLTFSPVSPLFVHLLDNFPPQALDTFQKIQRKIPEHIRSHLAVINKLKAALVPPFANPRKTLVQAQGLKSRMVQIHNELKECLGQLQTCIADTQQQLETSGHMKEAQRLKQDCETEMKVIAEQLVKVAVSIDQLKLVVDAQKAKESVEKRKEQEESKKPDTAVVLDLASIAKKYSQYETEFKTAQTMHALNTLKFQIEKLRKSASAEEQKKMDALIDQVTKKMDAMRKAQLAKVSIAANKRVLLHGNTSPPAALAAAAAQPNAPGKSPSMGSSLET